MFDDGVVVIWPGSCNIVALRHVPLFNFDTQHVARRPNRVAKCTQHVVPNNAAICCIKILRSFGWAL